MTFVHTSKVKDHLQTTLYSARSVLPERVAVLLFCLLPAEHAVVSNSERAQPPEAAVHLNLLPAETAAWLCPRQLEL